MAAVVAFEADDVDGQGRFGWSVVVVGRAALVTGPESLHGLRGTSPAPEREGVQKEVVRLSLEVVHGFRVLGPERLPALSTEPDRGDGRGKLPTPAPRQVLRVPAGR